MKPNRRRRLLIAAGALLATPPALSQHSRRVVRLGILTTLAPVPPVFWKPFTARLRKYGWTEGQNLVIEQRGTGGKPASALALAKELVGLRVDVVVALATVSALAVKQVSTSIPVVTLAGYPVEAGLATSLARPGGNVTGIASYASAQVWGKLPELLRELRPDLRHAGILWDYVAPGFPDGEIPLPELAKAAERLSISARVWKLHSQEDLGQALSAIDRGGIEALIVSAGGGISNLPASSRKIAELVQNRRLPAITDIAGAVFRNASCVLAYSPNIQDVGARLAYFVDRILRGAKPSELPFELPARFDLAVNLKAARAIGLRPPQSLLARADQLIE